MLVFPATPAANALFPDPAVGGQPQWQWDGTKWRSVGVSGGFIDAPANGQMYGRQDNAWELLSQTLAETPGFRVLLATQTVTAPVATVDWFYNFDATYDLYEIEVYDLQCSVNSYMAMRVSIDGATFISTSVYQYAQALAHSANAPWGGFDGLSASSAIATTNNIVGGVAATSSQFLIRFLLPWSTTRRKYFMTESISSYAPGGMVRNSSGGCYPATDPLRGLRFFTAAGTITAGIFNLYGISKA